MMWLEVESGCLLGRCDLLAVVFLVTCEGLRARDTGGELWAEVCCAGRFLASSFYSLLA